MCSSIAHQLAGHRQPGPHQAYTGKADRTNREVTLQACLHERARGFKDAVQIFISIVLGRPVWLHVLNFHSQMITNKSRAFKGHIHRERRSRPRAIREIRLSEWK
jgi:hypothetical protein